MYIVGISSERENNMTNLKNNLIEGEYLKDDGIMLGVDLAKFLKVGINDTIILFSSGYQGNTANGLFSVKGIIKSPNAEINRAVIYLPIKKSQEFFTAENMFSTVSFNIKNLSKSNSIKKIISGKIDPEKYEVMGWEELNKDLLEVLNTDRQGGIMMIYILYMVITFGLFGTILMIITERMREFKIMISIGMHRAKILIVTFIELLMILLMGIVISSLLSSLIIFYYKINPIQIIGDLAKLIKDFSSASEIPFSFKLDLIWRQIIAIIFIAIISSLYPLSKILKINPSDRYN